MMEDYKEERYTHIDTLKSQRELLDLIEDKITSGKPYFNTEKQRNDFMDLVAKSFLGSGLRTATPIVPSYPIKNGNLVLGDSIHHFALNIMRNIVGVTTTLYMRGPERKHEIQSVELWRRFKFYCMIVFPKAQSEALHASVERMTKGQSTTGYAIGDV
jgi:hypothetical protein